MRGCPVFVALFEYFHESIEHKRRKIKVVA